MDTPIDPNRKLGEMKLSLSKDKGCYQHLVDKLIYFSFSIAKRGPLKDDRASNIQYTNKA